MKLKVLLGALAVVFLAGVTVVVWPPSPPRSQVPAALQRPLDARVAEIETDMVQAAVCESIGTQCAYRCKAHTFDLDPHDAATLDQVAAAYADVDCHVVDAYGVDEISELVIAIRFTTPPTRSTPPDDATRADVAKVFPSHAAGAAWWYYTFGTFTLRDRLDRFAIL